MSTMAPPREEPAVTSRTAPDRALPGLRGLPGLVLWDGLGAGTLVVAGWWVGTPASVGAMPGSALTATSELAGLLAGLLVWAQLLLVGRVPRTGRAVGLDRLVAWHRALGLIVAHAMLNQARTGIYDDSGEQQEQSLRSSPSRAAT